MYKVWIHAITEVESSIICCLQARDTRKAILYIVQRPESKRAEDDFSLSLKV